jgi:Ser/Thr protein kinase RdoA (MazF antagonist)
MTIAGRSRARGGLLAYGQERMSRWYGQQIRPARVIVEHHERAVFVVSEPVRVVCKVEMSVEAARRERAALRELGGALPVPEVLRAANGPPEVTVLSYIEGSELDGADDPALWRRAGAIVARLHRHEATTPTWGDRPWCEFIPFWIERETARAAEHRLIDAETIARFNQHCTGAHRRLGQPQISTIHGDCKPAHLLHRGGRIAGVLDFGDYAHGDPAYDLIALTLWQPEQLGQVLAGYEADREFSSHVRAAAAAYRPLRLLAGALWLNEHHLSTDRYIRGLHQELETHAPVVHEARASTRTNGPVGGRRAHHATREATSTET